MRAIRIYERYKEQHKTRRDRTDGVSTRLVDSETLWQTLWQRKKVEEVNETMLTSFGISRWSKCMQNEGSK